MEIDTAVGCNVQEFVGKFLAEGNDDQAVGLEAAQEVEDVGGIGVGRVRQGHGVGEGPGGDGGGGFMLAAAGGAVGLGQDVEDFVGGARQGLEGGDAEGAGAEEDDVHGG